ncbi:site-specific DNA-methyltransferase [Acinetobacter baumannii]
MNNSQSENTMKHVTPEEGQSANIIAENIERLKELLPDAFTENGVNFETLRQLLGDAQVLDEGEEKYGLNWHGKKKARQIALTPSMGTLLPCPEESVNWDSTKNLFIEGDNLEVLKLLQKSYANKIKLIYIDPPYNTGNEFIYPDNFQDNLETYLKYTKQIDEEGFKFSSNTETSGRKHTNWLNMMYSRLFVAKQLLMTEGVIFISIGQDELSNLIALCNEIFGEENQVTICSRVVKTGGQKGVHFSPSVDYVLCYAKDINNLAPFREEISQNVIDKVYTKVQEGGKRHGEKYRAMGLYQAMLDKRANQRFYIECPDGTLAIPPGDSFPLSAAEGEQVTPNDGDGVWRWTYSRYANEKKDGNIEFIRSDKTSLVTPSGQNAGWNIYYKIWLNDRLEEGQLPGNILPKFESRHASAELKVISIPFDFPKPTALIKYFMTLCSLRDGDIVLDFFAGSGSTAHAVIDYSQENGVTARFIAVQLPEETSKTSIEYKQGFKNIAEIAKERIRRVSKSRGINGDNFDYLGMRVFKLSSSGIKPWIPNKLNIEDTLLAHEENLIPCRSQNEILYELLLKRGVDLSTPIEKREVAGNNLYSIGYGALFACLDESISHHQIEDIAQTIINWYKELKPFSETHVFFRDSAFCDDVSKTNMVAILEQNGISHVRSL